MFALWGRRRVGKTLLLPEFARDKRHLYFEATSGTRTDQLADFSDRLAEATGRAALSVPDWRRALDAVADWARDGPVLLVLDEFQFLARENGDIGSIINVWWRERGEELPIFLVLAGSEVGFFEREVVNYSATTYGRRAGQRRLRPFRAHDVELFVPSWSAQDKVAAYAVFGHMPYYLAQIREEASLADNILALVLRPDGLLHEEARLLLDQELHDASAYFSVLRAIAAGQTRVSQIAQRTAIPGGTSRVSQMLELLRKLWLVDRELPVTVTNPERPRQSFYRITDPYLRSGFASCCPPRGALPMRRARRVTSTAGCSPSSTTSSPRPPSRSCASSGCAARSTPPRRLVVGQGARASRDGAARCRSRARRRRDRRRRPCRRDRQLQVDRSAAAREREGETRRPCGPPVAQGTAAAPLLLRAGGL